MKLKELLETYSFDEIMQAVSEMFPETDKYREPLQQAYDLLMQTTPTPSKKSIRYKILEDDDEEEAYMGAEDFCFDTTWEVCLGKEVIKEEDVDLSDVEIAANSLVNLCFISRYPKEFEEAHKQLIQ
jgi:hypothetical protein